MDQRQEQEERWHQNHLVGQEHQKRSLGQLGRSLAPLALLIGHRNPHFHVLWPQQLGRTESRVFEELQNLVVQEHTEREEADRVEEHRAELRRLVVSERIESLLVVVGD